MKKHFIYASLALASFAMTACSDDKNEPVDEGNKDNQEQTSADLDYSSANATAWHNYMRQVSQLLVNDADQLYKAWTESYEGGESFAVTTTPPIRAHHHVSSRSSRDASISPPK